MEKPIDGIYNITGKQGENVMEFLQKRSPENREKVIFIKIPGFIFRPSALLLEMLHFFTLKQNAPKITRYIFDSGARNIIYDCKKAQKMLHWDPEKAIR